MGRTACTEPQCLYKGALYLFYFTGWKVRGSNPGGDEIFLTRQAQLASYIMGREFLFPGSKAAGV